MHLMRVPAASRRSGGPVARRGRRTRIVRPDYNAPGVGWQRLRRHDTEAHAESAMFVFAARNLLSRPLRSSLATLGLAVAVAGMVGLFSVAAGLDRMVDDAFGRIPGLVVVQRGAPIPLFSRLPAEWEQEIATIAGVRTVNPEVWARINEIEGKRIAAPPRFFFGTDVVTRQRLRRSVYRDALIAGRFLTAADRGTNRCVISRSIAEEFGKKVGDPLVCNGHPLEIVGIYHTGSLLLDVAVIADIRTVRRIALFSPAHVSCFYVEPQDGADPERLKEAIRRHFAGRRLRQDAWSAWLDFLPASSPLATGADGVRPSSGHTVRDRSEADNPLAAGFRALDRWLKDAARTERPDARMVGAHTRHGAGTADLPAPPRPTPPGRGDAPPQTAQQRSQVPSPGTADGPAGSATEPSPVDVRSAVEWSAEVERFSGDLDVILAVLTGIGMTIAALSIVNTMLMSVSERIVEFGILRANGWRRWDLLRLVAYESGLIGLAAGVAGSAAGGLLTLWVNAQWPDRVHLYASPRLLAGSIAFSVVLGVASGIYPALWATRRPPMEAIRFG